MEFLLFNRILPVVLALSCFAVPQPRRNTAAPINVLSSNAMQSVLGAAIPRFQQTAHTSVRVSYDVSTNVKRRIDAGEAFDLVLLTPALIDALVDSGKASPASRTVVARSRMALAGPSGGASRDTSTVTAFRQLLIDAPSVAFAKEGATGTFFLGLLQRWGLQDRLQARLKPLGAGSVVAEAVARGESSFGVLPVSEILMAPGVQLVGTFPKELNAWVVMEAILHVDAADADTVRELLTFLMSPVTTAFLATHGMERADGAFD